MGGEEAFNKSSGLILLIENYKIMTTLKIGDKAPGFSVKNQDGNMVSLEGFKGKKLVLFFYPKASTPGCTNEACNLSDNYKTFQSKGYEVLGVSADSAKRQSNFKNKYEFPYDLLADENLKVIKAYGVWGLKKFMGKEYEGIHRTTFVIDENGKIKHIIEKVKTKDHANQLLNEA